MAIAILTGITLVLLIGWAICHITPLQYRSICRDCPKPSCDKPHCEIYDDSTGQPDAV